MNLFNKTYLTLPIILFVTCLGFSFHHVAHAQSVEKSSLSFSPEYPNPGERVTIKLEAHSIDFDTALIVWRINGEVVRQSYSDKELTFDAGAIGEKHTVSVSAEDGSGKRIFTERTITISDVNIIWEGRTYTPPFFGGRALHSQGSDVAIQAIPSIAKGADSFYDINELSYSWFVNGSGVAVERGKAKHSVILSDNKPQQPLKIYLEVKDGTGEVRASKKFTIPNTQPKLLLYESSPFVGVRYDMAIGKTLSIFDGNISVVAEPYYMSVNTRTDNTLEYEWNIGGSKNDNPGSLTLGTEGGIVGNTQLLLTVNHKDYWLQNARKDTSVVYGSKNYWDFENTNTEAL